MRCTKNRNLILQAYDENYAETIITDRAQCCSAGDNLSEELYGITKPEILVYTCCDSRFGCSVYDTKRRCGYWPSFAHPRWLTCGELNRRRFRR